MFRVQREISQVVFELRDAFFTILGQLAPQRLLFRAQWRRLILGAEWWRHRARRIIGHAVLPERLLWLASRPGTSARGRTAPSRTLGRVVASGHSTCRAAPCRNPRCWDTARRFESVRPGHGGERYEIVRECGGSVRAPGTRRAECDENVPLRCLGVKLFFQTNHAA